MFRGGRGLSPLEREISRLRAMTIGGATTCVENLSKNSRQKRFENELTAPADAV
jgi:hypothetical protein